MKVQDVPKDIYALLCGTNESPLSPEEMEDSLERMGEAIKQAVREAVGEDQQKTGRLRISSLGHPDRKVYNAYKGVEGEKLSGSTRMKFLFGHVTEALLLGLTELAGHEVTEYQAEKNVNGVAGTMDCRIDGVIVDVKSASSYGFKKFKDGTLLQDDPFGYVAQIKGYAYETQDTTYGWLAFDKQYGHITTLIVSEEDHPELQWCVGERADHLKKLVGGDLTPPQCFPEVPDGKSGNMKLGVGCAYCDYKTHCFPALRTFLYSTGPRYLTAVENEPKVVEIREGF